MAKEEPRILTTQEILEADDLPWKFVDVPEWGGRVKIRALTMDEVQANNKEATVQGSDGTITVDARAVTQGLFRRAVIAPVFTQGEIEAVWQKKASVITRIVSAINELNNLSVPQEQLERLFRLG